MIEKIKTLFRLVRVMQGVFKKAETLEEIAAEVPYQGEFYVHTMIHLLEEIYLRSYMEGFVRANPKHSTATTVVEEEEGVFRIKIYDRKKMEKALIHEDYRRRIGVNMVETEGEEEEETDMNDVISQLKFKIGEDHGEA